eukprot:UN02140
MDKDIKRRVENFKNELKKEERGLPVLGGSFELINTNYKKISDEYFRGKFCLLYFGFSNCPEICPREKKK